MSRRSPEEATTRQFEELVRQYGRVIRAAVARAGAGRCGIEADDVEQSVLLEVWKQLRRERDIRSPSSYLYRAAVRETVRLMDRQRAREEQPMTEPEGGADERPSPVRALRALEIRRQIEVVLGGLLPDRRKAVRDHLVGYRVREIMERHGWSYGRARNLVARGMADLRQELSGRGFGND